MRAHLHAEKLQPLRDRLAAIRDVLRAAHMPSMAVTEAVARLRGLAVEIDLAADDLAAAQASAANTQREQFE